MQNRLRVTVALLYVLTFACSLVRTATAQDAAEPPAQNARELRWFKGNLHTHSLWSDGNDFPEMIADWYKSDGYDFLALSDHNVLSQGERWIAMSEVAKRGNVGGLERYRARYGDDWVETRGEGDALEVRLKPLVEFRPLFEEAGKFLMIQAEEITDHFESIPVHVNATNVRDLIKPQGGTSVRDTMARNLQAIKRQSRRTGRPMLAHVNHPNFGFAITAEDLAAVIEERFFEVYNGHPGVGHLGDEHHPPVERLWDIANTIRIAEMGAPPLFGIAVDDTHNYFGRSGPSPGRGWLMVRAKYLTPESLIAAIKRGEMYASSGVTLGDVRYLAESGILEIEIEPDGDAQFTTQFIGTRKDYDPRREPVLDADGKPLQATQRYSADIGAVLATEKGTKVRYELSGDELYVRAVVTSTKPPENPSFEGQYQQAWTQPVGSEKWIDE